MLHKKKNYGFTLIEIAIVIIILGVIAMFAFPGIFAQIERHRGQEALNTLNLIKSNIESCGVQNAYNFALCDTWEEIGMDNPVAGNFTYSDNPFTFIRPETIPFAQDTYSIQATRATGTISIRRANTGVTTCVGTLAFQGFCS